MNRIYQIVLFLITLTLVGQAAAVNIAVVVWRGETIAEKGFVDELNRLGLNPQIEIFDTNQDRKQLTNILRQRLQANLNHYDYVYTFGTTVSETVKTFLKGAKPQIFNIVADPVGSALIAEDRLGRDNTIGVTNSVATEKQIENARTVFSFKHLAVPYNPRESNSTLVIAKLKEAGQRYGFSVEPVRIQPDDDHWVASLQPIFDSKTVDAVYLPPDSYLISQADKVIALFNDKKIPTICAVSQYLKKGCLMGTVANYETLGKMAAGIVDRLQKGEVIAGISLASDPTPTFQVNEALKSQLGL